MRSIDETVAALADERAAAEPAAQRGTRAEGSQTRDHAHRDRRLLVWQLQRTLRLYRRGQLSKIDDFAPSEATFCQVLCVAALLRGAVYPVAPTPGQSPAAAGDSWVSAVLSELHASVPIDPTVPPTPANVSERRQRQLRRFFELVNCEREAPRPRAAVVAPAAATPATVTAAEPAAKAAQPGVPSASRRPPPPPPEDSPTPVESPPYLLAHTSRPPPVRSAPPAPPHVPPHHAVPAAAAPPPYPSGPPVSFQHDVVPSAAPPYPSGPPMSQDLLSPAVVDATHLLDSDSSDDDGADDGDDNAPLSVPPPPTTAPKQSVMLHILSHGTITKRYSRMLQCKFKHAKEFFKGLPESMAHPPFAGATFSLFRAVPPKRAVDLHPKIAKGLQDVVAVANVLQFANNQYGVMLQDLYGRPLYFSPNGPADTPDAAFQKAIDDLTPMRPAWLGGLGRGTILTPPLLKAVRHRCVADTKRADWVSKVLNPVMHVTRMVLALTHYRQMRITVHRDGLGSPHFDGVRFALLFAGLIAAHWSGGAVDPPEIVRKGAIEVPPEVGPTAAERQQLGRLASLRAQAKAGKKSKKKKNQ